MSHTDPERNVYEPENALLWVSRKTFGKISDEPRISTWPMLSVTITCQTGILKRSSECPSKFFFRHYTPIVIRYHIILSFQPYRTNPLVLPGAKVKRDQLKTESYLRHHPNPMMRAHPSQHDQPFDTLMKQKVFFFFFENKHHPIRNA